MEEDDEGEILDCKIVHGFRWYRLRVTTRAASTQALNIVGWAPLRSVDESDVGSCDSDENGELDGEELIELLDPATGVVIELDSPRALRPPVWDETREASAAAVQDYGAETGGRRDSRASRGGAPGSGSGAGGSSSAVRPVWLAYAGGKLFLREKVSGALSADEIAILSPEGLSLESVVSLADLPIPGFPEASPSSSGKGVEKDYERVAGAGGEGDTQEVDQGEEEEDVVEFACTDLGASVVECSSNSESSGGLLQNNLLVREASQRLPFPSRNSVVPSPSDVAFFFAPTDRDRVIVVDLGRARRIRHAGIEIFPSPGVEISTAVHRLVVETSMSGSTWTKLETWTPAPAEGVPERQGVGETDHLYSASVAAAAGSAHIARFVRYTLAPPPGSPTPPCLLTRLLASGSSAAVPGDEGVEEKKFLPFPAMTTDSRHIILVHAAGGEPNGDETGAAAAAAATLGDVSLRRLEIFFLDPEDGYRLVRTATLPWDMSETEVHRNAMLCDGDRLVMLTHKDSGVVKRTADTAVVAMRCRSGIFPASSGGRSRDTTDQYQEVDMEFDVRRTGGPAPTGLGYDRRNNVMWGWDSILKKLCRWRNDGLAPVFAPPRPTPPATVAFSRLSPSTQGRSSSEDDRKDSGGSAAVASKSDQRAMWVRAMLASASPSHRVEGLQQAGFLHPHEADSERDGWGYESVLRPKGQAALLLGYLERLGEPYGPPEEPVAEPRVWCELEAASGGKDDGSFSRLLVRGEDRSCKEPGINVLVLTENLDTGKEFAKGFATHESLHAANRLADYLNSVPYGRTVLITAQDDAAGNLSNSARRALLSVGAGTEEVAALGTHRRSSFAMIGRKGAKPGSVPQVLRLPRKGCATIRQRLPAPKVPMCVDVSKETLDSLVALILRYEPVLLQKSSEGHSQNESPTVEERAAPDADRQRDEETVVAMAGGFGGGVGQPELDTAVVLSAVNILTNQMFQLLRGSTPAAALALFSPHHVTPLLELLIAVIDQDRPAVEHQGSGQDNRSPSPSFPPQPCVQSHLKPGGRSELETRESAAGVAETIPSDSKAGTTVQRVSCLGVSAHGDWMGQGAVAAVAAGAEARRELLQKACLRLFITGMDLFFPSCAQRCSLLARYLSKYLSAGLSPAREAVLELLLRRMSDPGQLVELVSHIPSSSPDATTVSAGATNANSNEANPFTITPSVDESVAAMEAELSANEGVQPVNENIPSPDVDFAKKAVAMVAAPAPSAIELEGLLLSVATAEGISKIKALEQQFDAHRDKMGDRGNDAGQKNLEKNPAQGGVGEAAVEMLGRLTNQLLSSAACVIMESDQGAFDQGDEQVIGRFFEAMGVARLPTFATNDNADASRNVHANESAPPLSGGGNDTAVGAALTGVQETATSSVETPWLGTDVSAASTLVVLVTAVCRSCAALAAQAAETADAIGQTQVDGRRILSKEADRILQESPLGALLPMLASSLALLVEKHGVKIQGRLSIMAREIVGVMKMVSEVLERVPKDRLSVAGVSKGVGSVKKSVVMESKHNYEALTNEILFLEISGATKMTVTFDERSRTEDSYDYLVFWKDEAKTESWHPRTPKFSGTGGTCNFPGFGGRPPLVIESDRCWVEWRTDGSNEDWGWKFTATADIKKVASGGDGGGYWLLGLDRQLAGAGAALAGCLVISKPWGGKAEDDNAPWMEDDLLAGAVSPEAAAAVVASPVASTSDVLPSRSIQNLPSTSPPGVAWGRGTQESGSEEVGTPPPKEGKTPPSKDLLLLLEAVDRLEGTGGTALCKAMRARVGEDQGSVEAVNRAVYATCAALIWHQGLGAEALALAEGRVTTPSKALIKAWRFGQQMRQFFDYGDVRDAVNSQMELQRKQAVALESSWRSSNSLSLDDSSPTTRPILTRGPSVYQGAEEKVIAEVSERIVSRAHFLLSLPSQATRVSIQEQSKRRWSILARLGGVGATSKTLSQGNYLADGADVLEKWNEVVDEATAMRKLKSILVYRRKAAEMRERAKENSVSERIMKFAQCPADVGELEKVRQRRDQRAKLRAEGLRLTRDLVAAAASPPAKAWLLSSHSQSIRLTKREDRPGAHIHYLSSVEGCEPSAYLALAGQFALLTKSSLEVLKACSRPSNDESPAEAAERRLLAISSLQALALDYDLGDHEILKESILLEVLEPLLQGFSKAGEIGLAGGNNPDAADPPGVKLSDPSEPSEEMTNTDLSGNGGGNGDAKVGDDHDEDFDDTGSIGDDIAALEAELEGEEGELFDVAKGDGDGTLASHLPGGKEESVRKAAWCLFEVLLPRCVGLEGQGLETRLEEPTSFSHRLLAVLIRQVGRASANVQRSNTSLGIGDQQVFDQSSSPLLVVDSSAASGDESVDGATKGVTEAETSLPKETPLLLRGMRLRRDEPGRAAAHRDMSVRHSMSMWLRRDPCPVDAKPGAWYSPPSAGDTVARGPRWPRGDMSDGGPGGLGTVIELTKSNSTAKVQWDITGRQGTYKMGSMAEFPHSANDESAPASVEDLLVWEVVKVDPTVGGSVVMKGGANNLTQEERTEPWSQFGLSLLGNATLMYYAVSGEDQLFTLHSRTMLQPDVWTHVAVVQAKSRCRIYVDGEEDGEASLPNHMLTPGGMVKGVFESQHPYANNMDKMWDVRVEGAVSYSITFDPLTKTEPNHDYIRFLKDTDDPDGDYYGEDRYSGGRSGSESNWPGLEGRPPLIINAPSFTIYFHTDQSNNDWGFKLTSAASVAAPEELDESTSEASKANLNPFPVYLGQPPSYASSQRSASGYLWGASTYDEPLTSEQVRSLARASPPPEPSFMEEEACTDVLSLVQRCASSMDGVVSQGGGLSLEAGVSPLVSPHVLGPLLVILLQGSLKLRLAAARLCEKLLPQAPLEMVQVQLGKAGLSSPLVHPPTLADEARAAPLVRTLMLQLGQTLSVWSRLAADRAAAADSTGHLCEPGLKSNKASLTSGEEAFGLLSAHVGLLRALFAKEGWSAALTDCLREACTDLPAVTKALEEAGSRECSGGCTGDVAKVLCDPKLWMAHACLALLGGSFQGLQVGGKALALLGDGDGATLERCTVLALEWPRPHHLAAIENEKAATASKSTRVGVDFVCPAKEWEDLKSLGDAVIVCLHSEPDTPRVLPRGRVSPDSAPLATPFLSSLKSPPYQPQSPSRVGGTGLSAAAEAAVAAAKELGTPGLVPYVPQGLVEPLVEAFGVLSAADASDKRARYKPLVVETNEERILESPHPHWRGVDEVFPLDFPGADSIQLIFHEDCRTEEGTAFIRIYKDETKTVIWGESMYQGRDKDGNWPGLHGRPAVCVPASSCVVMFHAEDRNPDWGFHITAKAKCRSFTLPPEQPPLLGTSALALLQACGAKALVSLVTSWPEFVPHAQPLIKSLAERALGKKSSEEDLKKMATPRATRVVLESEHPYAHNADRKEAVRIEGAKKLIICFDDRSRTEHGCDYMVFYTDESMSKVYGDSKYTGGKDGHQANWPGAGGRPPLEIPASHFFFRWQTDGSVNDWGWRMTVTPVMDKMDAASLPPPMLDSKLASLLRICRDCPKEQSPAVGLEKFEMEPAIPPQPRDRSPGAAGSRYPSSLSSPGEWFSFFASQTDKTRPQGESKTAEMPVEEDVKIARGLRKHRPRLFVVNPRDAEDASLRAAPRSDSAEVGKVSVNDHLLVIKESSDWLSVIPIVVPVEAALKHIGEAWGTRCRQLESVVSEESSAETDAGIFEAVMRDVRMGPIAGNKGTEEAMWALRRQGDMLYLVPKSEASTHLVTLPDEGDPLENQAAKLAPEAARTGQVLAAFQVVDPPQGDEAGPISQGAFGIQAGAELTCESNRLWSALVETSHATASRFSRMALTSILAGSTQVSPLGIHNASPPLALGDFGGPHMFLTLLRATFAEARESGSDVDTAALDVLKKNILGSVGQSSKEGRNVADMLVAFATNELTTARHLANYLCPTKAVVRTFETAHNYADNTDTYTKISIPGAKRIRVVFDERCSTEMGCDFVRIYKDAQHDSYWGEHKYTGPATARGKVWAGIGDRPPLMVEANTMEVYFHSDSSNNDWGVRMSAYGIMQEPNAHQRAAYRQKRQEVGVPETELACWLMEALATESEGDYAKSILHFRSTTKALARFLEAADKKAKIGMVRLLTSLLQSACSSELRPSSSAATDGVAASVGVRGEAGTGVEAMMTQQCRLDILFEPGGPVPALLKLAEQEAKLEKDKGTDARSPLLQALVQACVVADGCQKERKPDVIIRDGLDPSFPQWRECADTKRSDNHRSVCATKSSVDVDVAPLLAVPGYVAPVGRSGLIRWHVKVLRASASGPRIGVSSSRGSWCLTWACGGLLQLRAGDRGGATLSFGPQVKAGDTVTVEVNSFKKEVTFYRNQALVGLAFGSEPNAWIMHNETAECPPWQDGGGLHLAVILSSLDDAVQIVQPPSALCPAIASMSPCGDTTWWGAGFGGANLGTAGDEEWLGGVRESIDLMSAVLKREVPAPFLAKELVPQCQQRAAVTLESSHPFGGNHTEETVTIPGATSLEVVFDARTAMRPADKISVSRDRGMEPERVLQGLVGATESSSSSGSSKSAPGYISGGTVATGISVGDSVVRGPAWNWGDQDGGPGGYGTVIDIRTWKGKPRSGIKVRWADTTFDGLYRWDYEGSFDLLIVAHGSTSTKPVIIKGDTLSIQVDPEAISESSSLQPSSDPSTPRLRLQNGAHVSIRLMQKVTLSIEFTLEGWFRLEANAEGCLDLSTYPLLSRGIMKGLSQINIKAVSSSDRRRSTVHVEMFAGDLSTGISFGGGVLVPGRWGHVAFAVDAAGSAKLFVDGSEVGSGSFRGPRMLLEDCDMVVGESLESEETLDGYIFDLRLWSRALTLAEVAQGRKALPFAGAHGLVINFPFSEGPGEIILNRGSHSEISAVLDLACTWNTSIEPPVEPALSHWGWRCTVTPIFSIDSLSGIPELQEELRAFRSVYGSGDFKHDLALVRYVNSFAEKKSFDAQRLLCCSWEDMVPSEEDLVREPLLRELCLWPLTSSAASRTPDAMKKIDTGKDATILLPERGAGVEETKGEEGNLAETKEEVTRDDAGQPQGTARGSEGATARGGPIFVLGKKGGGIAARFEVLQLVNRKLRDALPYFDLNQMDREWSAAHLLSACRGLIFSAIKEPVLRSALADTAYADGGQFDLHLSRSKAARHIHLGHTDVEGRWSVFGQAFRQMNMMHPRCLRTHSKLYNCVFMGEHSQDAGGPYRESWSMYAQELQSTALPLLIRTPNGVHAAGMGRDRYVPNPGATSLAQVEMFVFLGKMMGHAMRSKEYIGLNLSAVVWKALIGQDVQLSDLDNVDVLLTRSMHDIRTIDQKGVTPSIFSDIVMENFTALSLDDKEMELKPGGKSIPVTWDNRLEYADLVEKQRLSECCRMVKHIRKGMSMVVPLSVLGMFNWDEVETLVCGKPEVDVDLLEAVAEYSGCRKEQPHIKLFWQALREFTPAERSMLIKFTWGRTRLPLTAEGFSQRFKLQSFGRSPADDYLPVAHTCFFSLELPAYSSLEVMKERLLFAAFNCSAIDGDDNFAGMNAAALGWDWDEEDDGEEEAV
ncbi:unnamed protein product [Scytosiphon promiscuus]